MGPTRPAENSWRSNASGHVHGHWMIRVEPRFNGGLFLRNGYCTTTDVALNLQCAIVLAPFSPLTPLACVRLLSSRLPWTGCHFPNRS
jgi:hypothetical protein